MSEEGNSNGVSSLSVRLVAPSGIDCLVTIKDPGVLNLLKKFESLEACVIKRGWSLDNWSFPAKRKRKKSGKK